MNFNDENAEKNFWKNILNGVLNEMSSEHRIFKTNLDILILENIAETGIDPRLEGPPEHIANQVVKKLDDDDAVVKVKVKPPPTYMVQSTEFAINKFGRQGKSEANRIVKGPTTNPEKVQNFNEKREKDRTKRIDKLQSYATSLKNINNKAIESSDLTAL